jgi:hypothetical protein
MAQLSFPSKQPMPGNVRHALDKRELADAFRDRPQYQQDDYLKWIATAAGPTAKQQRLDQMLDELQNGKLFKGEPYTPPAKVEPATATEPAAKAATKPAAAKPAAKPPAKAAAKKPAAKKK